MFFESEHSLNENEFKLWNDKRMSFPMKSESFSPGTRIDPPIETTTFSILFTIPSD